MSQFIIENGEFYYKNKPFRILSGAIHYFRVVPEYWRDRLLKLKACGLNTVETYIPWNFHEIKPGEFSFEGNRDIGRFVEIAKELGLFVIIRPGPYICSEWDLGGLPAWLLADPGMRFRCGYQPFLDRIEDYFQVLLPKLVPFQCTKGGPIIAMQVENEYGSYGNDNRYLEYIKKFLQRSGIDVLLFTSDGASDMMLQGGTLPDVYKTVNFGSDPAGQFKKLTEYQKDKPLMCMEFWNGWFDHWGEKHHTREPEEVASVLDQMLSMGASVNFYMFHGGTNFGFYNGANYSREYQPTITSYDDDAPLNESGDPTPKYFSIRKTIGKYFSLPDVTIPAPMPKVNLGEFTIEKSAALFDILPTLSQQIDKVLPEPMEMLGQNFGFILYRTFISGPREKARLVLQYVHDRAQIFVNEELVDVMERDHEEKAVEITVPKEGIQLDILVENMGRINYGPFLMDRKGITEGVRLGNQFLYNWSIFPLPLDHVNEIVFTDQGEKVGPAFYQIKFQMEELGDTFLSLPGWTKGVCFLNGFNLGRYWNKGPQKTLYVPAPLLRLGENELIIFELHGTEAPIIEFRDKPDLG